MKRITALFSILVALMFIPYVLTAKRAAAPKKVSVELNGVKYYGNVPLIGYVGAVDNITKRYIWTVKAYSIIYDYNLETDVQDVYITEINIENGLIIIKDEKNNRYKIDLKSGKLQGDAGVIDFTREGRKIPDKLSKVAAERIAKKIAWDRFIEFTSQDGPLSFDMKDFDFEIDCGKKVWHVYISPASSDPDTAIMGGDADYKIDSKTGEILEEVYGE